MLTQDPIGLAGGVNLYAYAGNNPVAFGDPLGLCPEHMRGLDNKSMADCQEWNQEQVKKALEIIEKHKGTSPVLPPSSLLVWGVNDDFVRKACEGGREVTDRGCISRNGTLIVNADRDPKNIAATMQHEYRHEGGSYQERHKQLGPYGEKCAIRQEALTSKIFGAIGDKYFDPSTAIHPRACD